MRPLLITSLAILALNVPPICRAAYAAEPEVIDGVAAVVNGDVITYSQVRGLVMPREKRAAKTSHFGDSTRFDFLVARSMA